MKRALWVCAALAAACGGKKTSSDPEFGVCTFKNASGSAFEGVAAGAEICIPQVTKAMCSPTKLEAVKMPTTGEAFHAGAQCEALGFTACEGAAANFQFQKPCTPKPVAEAPKAPSLALPPAEPGPAYIATEKGVAVFLPDGTAKLAQGTKAWLQNLTLGDDGAVYAAGSDDTNPGKQFIWKLVGDTATKFATAKASVTSALAIAKDGTLYHAANADLLKFDGKKFTSLPKPGMSVVQQLAFDGDGNLVAAGFGGAAVFKDGAWQPVTIPDARPTSPVVLVGTGASLLFGVKDLPLYKREGDKLVQVPGELTLGDDLPATTSSGLVGWRFYQGSVQKTQLLDPDGGSTISDQIATGIAVTALDARGRLWFVDSGALTVASTLGKDTTTYAMGSLPALAAVSHRNNHGDIVVVGAGPTKLPQVEAVQFVDKVTATIYVGKDLLANTDIEICTFAALRYKVSPCEESTSRQSATTNAKGEVVLEKVPVGNYKLVFKVGEKWALAGETFLDLSKAEPVKDLGTLRYAR